MYVAILSPWSPGGMSSIQFFSIPFFSKAKDTKKKKIPMRQF
jgi:hypothetical protein